jgi:hypothetical protein
MSQDVKAPERICRGCSAEIPPQPRGPGRPREFCSRACRRDYYHRQEQAEVERQRAEERERNRREYEERFRGWSA